MKNNLYFFFTQDGWAHTYDEETDETNCLLDGIYFVEKGRGKIIFTDKDGEVIDECTLHSFKEFDKIF